MGIEAKEKTALATSVGADERQSFQTVSENSIPTSEPEINDQSKIPKRILKKCTEKCSVWLTPITFTQFP